MPVTSEHIKSWQTLQCQYDLSNDKNVAYYEQVATASPLDNFFVFVLLYAQCRVNMIDMMKNMSHNFLVYFKGKTIYLPGSFWTDDL